MTELVKQPCPFVGCESSNAFFFNTEGHGKCFSCGKKYPKDRPFKDWAEEKYPPKDNHKFVPKGITTQQDDYDEQEEELLEMTQEDVFSSVGSGKPEGSYVGSRGISSKTMELYGVKTYGTTQEYIYPSGGIKVRKFPKDFMAKNGFKPIEFFGMNLFPANSSKILTICEGELDALSAYQMLQNGRYNNPVVSLPSANPSGKLWENCKAWIDSFSKIVLSADNDDAGKMVAHKMSLMFPSKVFIMDHGSLKDANDFLQAGKHKAFVDAWFAAKKYRPDDMLVDSEDYLNLYDESPDFEYFPTGVPELDEKILGINKGYFTVIQAPTGVGKSLAPNTLVLKADGSIVRADEVSVGDQLMGPDSKPRNVTNVNLQNGPMYRIIPVKGEAFECNVDHILSLKHTSTNEVKNVVLTEYLTWSKSQKHLWKLWRTGVDMFDAKCWAPSQPYLAYAVGVYLGDGHKHGPAISAGKKKEAVINKLLETGYLKPTSITFDRGCFRYGMSTRSTLWDYVSNHTGQTEDCLTVRKIPKEIKYAPADTRKAVLAGLLDTDGSTTNGGAEITQKSEVLADDICFVARSLGLAAYKKVKAVKGVDYFRVGISGDLTILPTVRLKFNARKQKKDVLKTGFTVEPIGEGTFRGIALDGDHLFLLGDFTVNHNTEVMRYLEYQCLTTSDYTFAYMHLEESRLRSILGLVSYELGDNLTLKKFIDEKGRDGEVRESIARLSASERMIQFNYRPEDGYESLLDKIKYLVAAYEVDFVFFEPIQDLVTGEDKEGKLADLSSRLGTMASELGVGIITIAHQNQNGDTMYATMIGKKAAFEIVLSRDQESEDLTDRNRTHIKVGRKNRVGLGNGPAGAFDFDHKSYTLKPATGPIEPKVNNKGIF